MVAYLANTEHWPELTSMIFPVAQVSVPTRFQRGFKDITIIFFYKWVIHFKALLYYHWEM